MPSRRCKMFTILSFLIGTCMAWSLVFDVERSIKKAKEEGTLDYQVIPTASRVDPTIRPGLDLVRKTH